MQLVKVPGVDRAGTPVSFNWTPGTPGNRTLTAVLTGAHYTKTGRTDTLNVSVPPAPKTKITTLTLRPAIAALHARADVQASLLQTVGQIARAYKIRDLKLVRSSRTQLRGQVQSGSVQSFASSSARALTTAVSILIVHPTRT